MTVIGRHLYMKLSLCVLTRCLQSRFSLLIKALMFYLLILRGLSYIHCLLLLVQWWLEGRGSKMSFLEALVPVYSIP